MRHKTGYTAPTTGTYRFAGYIQGPQTPLPTLYERRVMLLEGSVFPFIPSNHRAAYWVAAKA